MNIRIDNRYTLTSDPNSVTLSEVKVTQEGEKKGKEYLSLVGYFRTVNEALKYIPQHAMKTSDAESFKELIAIVRQYEAIVSDISASLGDESRAG